jgi:hypothetical protein
MVLGGLIALWFAGIFILDLLGVWTVASVALNAAAPFTTLAMIGVCAAVRKGGDMLFWRAGLPLLPQPLPPGEAHDDGARFYATEHQQCHVHDVHASDYVCTYSSALRAIFVRVRNVTHGGRIRVELADGRVLRPRPYEGRLRSCNSCSVCSRVRAHDHVRRLVAAGFVRR